MEFTIARNGNQGFVGPEGGGGKPEAQIRVAVDGYSAPITAGNFISNILSGAYEGSRLAIGGETVSVTSEKLEGNWEACHLLNRQYICKPLAFALLARGGLWT